MEAIMNALTSEVLTNIWNTFETWFRFIWCQQLHSLTCIKLLKRGLGGYFKYVYGTPISNIETLEEIMITEKVSVNGIMFIGDSPEDQQCAIDSGFSFIGRKSDRDLNGSIHSVFTDFIPIKTHMKINYEF